jgi:hypothetical protein
MYDNLNFLMAKAGGYSERKTRLNLESLDSFSRFNCQPQTTRNKETRFDSWSGNTNFSSFNNYNLSSTKNTTMISPRVNKHYEDYIKSSLDMVDFQLNFDLLKFKVERMNKMAEKIGLSQNDDWKKVGKIDEEYSKLKEKYHSKISSNINEIIDKTKSDRLRNNEKGIKGEKNIIKEPRREEPLIVAKQSFEINTRIDNRLNNDKTNIRQIETPISVQINHKQISKNGKHTKNVSSK